MIRSLEQIGVGTALAVSGAIVSLGAMAADVWTCPGEVERLGGDIPIIYCDENPQEDDWFNRPGTAEQRLAMAASIVATFGVAMELVREKD